MNAALDTVSNLDDIHTYVEGDDTESRWKRGERGEGDELAAANTNEDGEREREGRLDLDVGPQREATTMFAQRMRRFDRVKSKVILGLIWDEILDKA